MLPLNIPFLSLHPPTFFFLTSHLPCFCFVALNIPPSSLYLFSNLFILPSFISQNCQKMICVVTLLSSFFAPSFYLHDCLFLSSLPPRYHSSLFSPSVRFQTPPSSSLHHLSTLVIIILFSIIRPPDFSIISLLSPSFHPFIVQRKHLFIHPVCIRLHPSIIPPSSDMSSCPFCIMILLFIN